MIVPLIVIKEFTENFQYYSKGKVIYADDTKSPWINLINGEFLRNTTHEDFQKGGVLHR